MTPILAASILRTQSDRRLVTLARAGHEAAFEAIVERYRPQLRRYCMRLLPEGRADDALQQAFLLAWRALQEGRNVRELRPWLYAIAHNTAISQLRDGVFDYVELLDTLEGAGGTEADVERRSVMRQTLAAVAALPQRQRDALLAVALQGRPQAEVAVEMGLTDNGLRQLLFRARTTVRSAATALTPLPMLAWLLRGPSPTGMGVRAAEAAAGAGAVAGGASALPTGTALVVAGTLAVGGAVGLQTPSTHHRAPTPAAVAATPTAAPVSATDARTALARTGVRVVRRPRVVAAARPARGSGSVIALRGHHGVRVAVGTSTAVALHPLAFVPTHRFVSTAAPVAAPPATPGGAPAAAPGEALAAPPAAAVAATAPSGDAHPASPADDSSAAPRAKPDDEDDNNDERDDGDDSDSDHGSSPPDDDEDD